MNIGKRLMHCCIGILILLGCAAMILFPEYGYRVVIILLDVALLIWGVRLLIFYFTMARFMVGGMRVFYQALILIDLGLFAFSLEKYPQTIAMLYLVGTMAFSGGLSLLRALEARRMGAGSWRTACAVGACRLVLSVACLFYLDSVNVMTDLYCLGLVNTAVSHFITAFRPAVIVYVDS